MEVEIPLVSLEGNETSDDEHVAILYPYLNISNSSRIADIARLFEELRHHVGYILRCPKLLNTVKRKIKEFQSNPKASDLWPFLAVVSVALNKEKDDCPAGPSRGPSRPVV